MESASSSATTGGSAKSSSLPRARGGRAIAFLADSLLNLDTSRDELLRIKKRTESCTVTGNRVSNIIKQFRDRRKNL